MEYWFTLVAWLAPAMSLLAIATSLAATPVVLPHRPRVVLVFLVAVLLAGLLEVTMLERDTPAASAQLGLMVAALVIPFAAATLVARLRALGWLRVPAGILAGWITMLLVTDWLFLTGSCRLFYACS
jgi:hypothetical protein